MKKLISITLSLLMLTSSVSVMPITANAVSVTSSASAEYSSGDFTYTLSDTLEATITSYSGTDEVVIIPETIDGYAVTEIGANAFYGCTTLKELELAKAITKIGQTAFAECTSLTKVFIPKSLKTIDTKCITDEPAWRNPPYNGYYGSFYNCKNLTEVEFETGIETIPAYLFGNSNVGISELHMPNTVKTIEKCAFTACEKLKTLTLPSNLETIGWHAFTSCKSLENLTIPKNLSSVEIDTAGGGRKGPFTNCSSLGEVSFEEGMTTVPTSLFCGATGITSIKFPESMETISESAFEGCTNLTYLNIKSGINSIGSHAFRYCTGLKSIDISSSVKSIGAYCFDGCSSLENVNMADNSVGIINYGTFSNCANLKKITLPNGVNTIFAGAFLGTTLTEITIPKSVNNIVRESFGNISEMTIYGSTGSYAETFSQFYKIPFVDITKKTLIGDVNADGIINILDATNIQKYLANLIELTDEQKALADIDKDGILTIIDSSQIRKYLAGLVTELG